jgi:pentatricopeptide repeat protein
MSCSPPPEPDHQHHRLLATLARHGRLAAAATLFSTAVRTTRALNTILAPSVLLLAAPTAAPDAATFRVLASALCRASRPSAAADLLRCMPPLLLDPDSPLCRAVLSSLCRCAPARDAAAFLDDMRRWGVSPSGPDHRAVLRALMRDGMLAEAYRRVRKEMDLDGVAPGTADFELMLRAFGERGQFDAVDEAFDEMLLRGLVPGVSVYNVYVAALCRRGDLAGARRMVSCMERAGCPPDVRTFGVVVAGCVSAGDKAAAREVASEDAPALAELLGLLRADGHVADAHWLLLEVFLHGGCTGVDASGFGQLICASDDCSLSL